MKTRYWQDFTEGAIFEFGDKLVTESEIIEFAQQYDPLTIHIDPIAARKEPLGVFCASAVHVLAMAARMTYDHLYADTALVAGRVIDKWQMLAPVQPGQRLHIKAEVAAVHSHKYKTDCGWVDFNWQILDADGNRLMTFFSSVLVQRRP